MSVTLNQALLMLKEPKWLVEGEAQWTAGKDRKANFVWKMNSRTRTQAAMPQGLWLRMQTWGKNPAMSVFQLTCDLPSVRAHINLYRLECSIPGTHLNTGWGPEHLCNLFIDSGVTHEHSYLHYEGMPDAHLIPGEDPMAEIVEPPPSDFDSALVYVCDKLKIQNRNDIPPTPRQGYLL
jgi:hypothetical protein